MEIKKTKKEKKVIDFMKTGKRDYFNCICGLEVMNLIFSDEIIKNYSFARQHKTVIETMTFSYLGKMVKKGLIKRRIDDDRLKSGYYVINCD